MVLELVHAGVSKRCQAVTAIGDDHRQHPLERHQYHLVIPVRVSRVVTGMRVDLREDSERLATSNARSGADRLPLSDDTAM
jgi:hypothetical protein